MLTNGASDMLTWAFDDARQEGDTTVAAYGEKGYYAVLFHSRSRNDYHTVSVRHILVSDEDTANDVLKQYTDGEQTEDAFAALAVANSTDSNASSGGLYTDIYRGQMVSEFEDWCFDPSRQPGDTGIVQTSYGYHVMYFVGTKREPLLVRPGGVLSQERRLQRVVRCHHRWCGGRAAQRHEVRRVNLPTYDKISCRFLTGSLFLFDSDF